MKDTSGPAFPVPPNSEEQKERGYWEYPQGMSLRDYFAGQALSGWLASFAGMDSKIKPEEVAKESFQFADAMIAERYKEAPDGR